MISGVQADTLHYFNTYAVRDWVDTSYEEDAPSLPDMSTFDVNKLLLSSKEHQGLH